MPRSATCCRPRPRLPLATGAALASLSLLAAACGPSRSLGAVGSTPSTTAPPAEILRVGVLDDPTPAGRAVDDAVRLALSQATSSRAGIALDALSEPAGTTARRAAAAARRLVAEGVVAVIGPETTAEVDGAEPVLSAAGIPDLVVTATAATLPAPGWQGFFRVAADDAQQGLAVTGEAVEGLGASSVAVLAGRGSAAAATAEAAADEVPVDGAVLRTWRQAVTLDGAPAVAAAAAGLDPGAVICIMSPQLAEVTVRNLRADRFEGPVVLAAPGSPTAYVDAAVAGGPGTYVASPADDLASVAFPDGAPLVLVDAYRAAFGADPPAWVPEAYDAARFVAQAVTSGASEPASITEYLDTHSFSGVSATIAFASSGDLLEPPEFISSVASDGVLRQTGSRS